MALPEHELLARLFRALGDATRLRMIDALMELGEATQAELVRYLGVTQSRASEHLQCLVWSGLVYTKPLGSRQHYRLTEPYAESFMRLARTFLYDVEDSVGGCKVAADRSRVV